MKQFSYKNKLSVFIVPFFLAAFFLTVISTDVHGADRKKILVVVSVKEAVTLDPQVSLDGQSPLIWRAVYEPLLGLKDDSLEVIPGLAEKWDVSSDGTVYTFYLKKGVRFHDGSPFTAASIKFTLERAMKLKKAGAYVLDPVKGRLRPFCREAQGQALGVDDAIVGHDVQVISPVLPAPPPPEGREDYEGQES